LLKRLFSEANGEINPYMWKQEFTMNSDEFASALKELMDAYNEYRAKWIEMFGDDTGFDRWFTTEVKGPCMRPSGYFR
jgi:hypothetical protein